MTLIFSLNNIESINGANQNADYNNKSYIKSTPFSLLLFTVCYSIRFNNDILKIITSLQGGPQLTIFGNTIRARQWIITLK